MDRSGVFAAADPKSDRLQVLRLLVPATKIEIIRLNLRFCDFMLFYYITPHELLPSNLVKRGY